MRSRRRPLLPTVAAVWAAAILAPVAMAADPSGSASPEQVPIEVWLDRPLPVDATAGESVEITAFLWDREVHAMAPIEGPFLRLLPASGDAEPPQTAMRSDWPGHVYASLAVPAGGVGSIQVGFQGQECNDSNVCRDVELLFRIAGTGPPPDAGVPDLVFAQIEQPSDDVVAGQPFEVTVDLDLRGQWDPSRITLPDRLILLANNPRERGPDLASSEIRPVPTTPRQYRGTLTIPEPGDANLVAAMPGAGGADVVLASSETRISVEDPDTLAAAAGGGTPTAPGPPLPLVGALAALLVVAAFLVRRVFADL